MVKYFFALLLFIFTTQVTVAQSLFDKYTEPESGTVIYRGEISLNELLNEPSFTWMDSMKTYKSDSNAVTFLKKYMNRYQLLIFLGTWCEDSHHLIPQLYKIISASEFPLAQTKLYGVDRNKEGKYLEGKIYNITKVPTIIVSNGPKEIGRITETVKVSLEQDLIDIILSDSDFKE